MSDDYTQEITVGLESQAILESQAWKVAFDMLEADIYEKWKMTSVMDDKTREKLFLQHDQLKKMKISLESLVQNGTIAKTRLQQLQERVSSTFRRSNG